MDEQQVRGWAIKRMSDHIQTLLDEHVKNCPDCRHLVSFAVPVGGTFTIHYMIRRND